MSRIFSKNYGTFISELLLEREKRSIDLSLFLSLSLSLSLSLGLSFKGSNHTSKFNNDKSLLVQLNKPFVNRLL